MRDDARSRYIRMIWLVYGCVFVVIAIAQLDEHRRFNQAMKAYEREFGLALVERDQATAAMERYLKGEMPIARGVKPVESVIPPPPAKERFELVSRIRRGICVAAYAICVALPIAYWLAAVRDQRIAAHAMLASAVLGMAGMLLGWGHLANWNEFRLTANAGGYGLILIPLSVAVLWQSYRAHRDFGDTGLVAGRSISKR